MSTATMRSISQAIAVILLGLVVGSMFGIWRGYDFTAYSPGTYLEVHQGAVRGLNLLLPLLGGISLVLTLGLAVAARTRSRVLSLYLLAALLIVVAAIVTRFGNQPINELVMGWTPTSMPADWTELRDTWWRWHLIRLAAGFLANIVLLTAVFADRTLSALTGKAA